MAACVGRLCCAGIRLPWCRALSLTAGNRAGQKWRLENNLAANGTEYGLMTDLPDWSYADGRPAPPLKGQERRKKEREEFARRVVLLSSEVDGGMQRWREGKDEAKATEERRKALQLKPKGGYLQKKK
ncbi:39S ribosomal protein L52, mitochondrial [Conger conger]|uniref:39S ribosomal protein L52, mitochondrial n=1 Tax=Conger conger TaxID=82655 RepID=UPI002A598C50|nr:39S ribosomal protein L52, mitochondrial [Conger conger]